MDLENEIKSINNFLVSLDKRLLKIEAQKQQPELEFLGVPVDGVITLQEIEATVKVLKNYKQQGFKSIQL